MKQNISNLRKLKAKLSHKSPSRNGEKLACFKNKVQALERWSGGMVPSTQIRYLTSAYKSRSRGSDVSFWPPQAPALKCIHST